MLYLWNVWMNRVKLELSLKMEKLRKIIIRGDILKKFPDDFTTIDFVEHDKGIYNGELINDFIDEIISSNNNTEIIIRNGMVVFKKGENIFVITPEQMFATTED